MERPRRYYVTTSAQKCMLAFAVFATLAAFFLGGGGGGWQFVPTPLLWLIEGVLILCLLFSFVVASWGIQELARDYTGEYMDAENLLSIISPESILLSLKKEATELSSEFDRETELRKAIRSIDNEHPDEDLRCQLADLERWIKEARSEYWGMVSAAKAAGIEVPQKISEMASWEPKETNAMYHET